MNRSLQRTLLRPLPFGAALLLLGSGVALMAGAGRASDASADRSDPRAEARAMEEDAENAVRRPARLVRATLSMPYFSFAQSLRPRGRFPQ